MRVLIASDKFKHSLKSEEVAAHLTKGLLAGNPDLQVDSVALADGGDGTVTAALSSGFKAHHAVVSGPTGQPVEAVMAVRANEAVIEVAAASGLIALPGGVPAPLNATSLGTGQLILEALDLGCTRIFLGAGGSACTDGGAGLLQGLGAKLYTADGQLLELGGGALARLAAIDLHNLDSRVRDVQFVLASDVENPLLGELGCAAVFGPQKGATARQVDLLEAALAHFVCMLGAEIGDRAATLATQKGAGAAGGIGYAALAVLGAQFEPGVEVVSRMIDLEQKIQRSSLVITGEGSLDEQSLAGKAPLGVSRAAGRAGVPVIAVCGRTTLPAAALSAAGFTRTYALTAIEADEQRCMSQAGQLLETIGTAIAIDLAQRAPEKIGKKTHHFRYR